MGNELTRVTRAELEKQWRTMNAALERLGQVEARGRGIETRRGARLLFGIDLTASREWALDGARRATAAMFDAVAALGPVAVKLAYFRAHEFKAGPWQNDAGAVCRSMLSLGCITGYTQIGEILRLAESEAEPVSAVIFIGDTCEEDGEELAALARRLRRKRIPVYVFHERDRDGKLDAREILEAIAKASGGVYCPFGAESAAALRELLSTVAAFSAAGAEGVKRVGLPVTLEGQELQKRLLLAAP
jgi:hypothetical protein